MSHNVILKDLHKVLVSDSAIYEEEYVNQEITLTKAFQKCFGDYVSSKKCQVSFLPKTTLITNIFDQSIYVPNQWFIISSYFVDFCTELLTYQEYFYKICKRLNIGKAKDIKLYASELKSNSTDEMMTEYTNAAINILMDDFPNYGNYSQIANYLWNFASDYNWWAGNKTIDRHDFYVSSILNQMNLVNASSEYAAVIVHSFATNIKLRTIADNVYNISSDYRPKISKLEHSNVYLIDRLEQEVTDENIHYTNMPQEKKANKISISAASLERFKNNI